MSASSEGRFRPFNAAKAIAHKKSSQACGWGKSEFTISSALLAAIQAATGVAGVLVVRYRQRGLQPDWTPLPETLTPPANRILRLDNDPSQPEAGSLHVIVEGGK